MPITQYKAHQTRLSFSDVHKFIQTLKCLKPFYRMVFLKYLDSHEYNVSCMNATKYKFNFRTQLTNEVYYV